MAELFPVTTNDYEEVATFLLSQMKTSSSKGYLLDFFKFWWDENPAFSGNMERGWVLRNGEGIKGFLGVIPTFFQLAGKEKVIFNGTSWHVSKDCRKNSINLFYHRLKVSKNSICFNSTGSPRTSAITKALRFIPLPRVTSGRSVVIFDSKKSLKKRLKGGLFLDPVINLGAFTINKFQSLRLKTALKVDTSDVREIIKFDTSFDDLWARTQNIFLNTNIRKAHILQWLCFSNKRRKIRAFGYYKEGKLCGYLILALKEYETNVWICLDIWVDPQQDNAIPALITVAVQLVKQESGDIVIFNHFSSEVAKVCQSMGMIKFSSRKNEMIRISPEYRKLIQAKNSYFSIQGDLALT
ncbi:MAG: hypothetical protein ACQ9MH_00080 [Nitrospinales bacterium]